MNLLSGLIILRGIFQDPFIWIGEYINHIITAAAPSPIVTCAQSSPPLASTVFMSHLLWTYIAALSLLLWDNLVSKWVIRVKALGLS
jgi:hypothetical protein